MSDFSGSSSVIPYSSNCLLIDWFSLTIRYDPSLYDSSFDFVCEFLSEFLGLSLTWIDWLEIDGFHGFSDRIYFNGISIHYNGKASMGLSDLIWVEMSGQGCRAFEEYSKYNDWLHILQLPIIDPKTYHLTRLDIAYDDFIGVLDLSVIDSNLTDLNVVTTFKSCSVEHSYILGRLYNTINSTTSNSNIRRKKI